MAIHGVSLGTMTRTILFGRLHVREQRLENDQFGAFRVGITFAYPGVVENSDSPIIIDYRLRDCGPTEGQALAASYLADLASS